MRKVGSPRILRAAARAAVLLLIIVGLLAVTGPVLAAGPSGSTECHVQDDDCDGTIDEDTGTITDDNDGDGLIDEDPPGDINGDGDPDDDLDGLIDEDPADDDGDGAIDEDPPGDALDDPGENQVDCNESSSTDAGGVAYVYAGSNGAEVCSDDSTTALPVDGRIIVDTDEGYVAIDGDSSNPGVSNGYLRVDQSGFHCGDENNLDSTADQTNNDQTDCG